MFTDPPYNVPIAGHAGGKGKIQHKNFAMVSGEMNEAEFKVFLIDALTLVASHSRSSSIHFICMDWRHTSELLSAGSAVYSEFKNICVWKRSSNTGAEAVRWAATIPTLSYL